MASISVRQLVMRSMREIGVLASGAEPTTQEMTDVRNVLIGMLDTWRTENLMVPITSASTFTLSTSQSVYTMYESVAADFNTVRPYRVHSAVLIDAAGIRTPLDAVSYVDYQRQSTHDLTGTPDSYCYIPEYPIGKLALSCNPIQAQILLMMEAPLVALPASNTTEIDFPPGYLEAVVYNLAVRIASQFEVMPSQLVLGAAAASRQQIKSNNLKLNQIAPVHPHTGRKRYNINEGP